ncbi:hypothetical protein AAG906_004761 [Vitis piasezkii]
MANVMAKLPKKQAHPAHPLGEQWWTLHVDKTSKISSFEIGLILQSPTEELLEQVIYLNFSTSNNETEYEVENVKADALNGIAATLLIKEVVMLPVYLQVTTSITPEPVYSSNETRDLPEEGKKAHKLCPYLKCLSEPEAN